MHGENKGTYAVLQLYRNQSDLFPVLSQRICGFYGSSAIIVEINPFIIPRYYSLNNSPGNDFLISSCSTGNKMSGNYSSPYFRVQ